MSDNRREALEALRDKVKAGEFPTTWRELNKAGLAYGSYGLDMRGFAWEAFNGSQDAAVKLLETVLPGWDWLLTNEGKHAGEAEGPVASLARPDLGPDDTFICSSKTPACALLLSILSALISETPKGEMP